MRGVTRKNQGYFILKFPLEDIAKVRVCYFAFALVKLL